MSQGAGGRSPSGRGGSNRVTYDQIRERFLAELPRGSSEELEYFTRLGMYIFFRWEAIEDDVEDGKPFDDTSSRWDECTEREYDRIKADAQRLVRDGIAQRWLLILIDWVRHNPVGRFVAAVRWCWMRALEHFVGAVGLLLFGLLIVWLAPHLAKEIRSAVDELSPQETRPPVIAPSNAPAAEANIPWCRCGLESLLSAGRLRSLPIGWSAGCLRSSFGGQPGRLARRR